jgi:acyl carrier protein
VTPTADAILPELQKAYDLVKTDEPRTIALDDKLIEDLDLDSLDVIDLMSVLEDVFPTDVIDAVVDRAAEITTVRELVDAIVAAS